MLQEWNERSRNGYRLHTGYVHILNIIGWLFFGLTVTTYGHARLHKVTIVVYFGISLCNN